MGANWRGGRALGLTCGRPRQESGKEKGSGDGLGPGGERKRDRKGKTEKGKVGSWPKGE